MILIEASQPGGGVPRYQLKITLKWSRPAIWRRVVVRADMRLDRLHDTICWKHWKTRSAAIMQI